MASPDLTFTPGQAIMFRPGYSDNGPERRGIFKGYTGGSDSSGRIVTVHLTGDPYAVCVYEPRIRPATDKESTQMPTVKPKAKDLRRQAKALGIEGWEDMSLNELIEAVDEAQEDEDDEPTPAKKTSAKKATSKSKSKAPVVDDDDEDEEDDDEDDDEDDSDEDSDEDTDDDDEDEEDDVPVKKATAKKAAAKKSTSNKAASKPAAKKAAAKKAAPAPREREIAENGNPYPPDSNLHYITELLIKGGKLASIVKKVNSKLVINSRGVERDEEETLKEWHRRVIIVSQKLRNDFGFTEDKDGRGLEAVIRLVPPA